MAEIHDPLEVYLNGTYFKLRSKPRRFLSSQWPAKITMGDQGPQSHPITSTWSIFDHQGGIGAEIIDPSKDADRCWWSDMQQRYRGHMVHQRLATETSTGTASNVGFIKDFIDVVYASFGIEVQIYTDVTQAWGSSVRTLAAPATDAEVGLVNGNLYLVVPNGTDVDYCDTGGSWAENTTQAIEYVEFWNDALWGIDNTGQLYWTQDLTTWTADARVQLPNDYVLGLFAGPAADGSEILYAPTKVGLYAHDSPNERFVRTSLVVPFHPHAGRDAQVWRGSIYFPAGAALYKYIPSSQQTIITLVGPDQDYGLPSTYRGSIKSMVGSQTELLVAVDGEAVEGATQTMFIGSHHSATVFPSVTSYTTILGYDERGWEVKWAGTANARPPSQMHVGYTYNDYRLWWGHGQKVWHMTMPLDIVNPNQISNMEFATGGTFKSGWLVPDATHETWTALAAYLHTKNPTSDEKVVLNYALNWDDNSTAQTTLGTQSASGETSYTFNDTSGNPAGVQFRAIEFILNSTRGSTTTNSPDVVKLALAFKKSLNVAYGWDMIVDCSEGFGGLTVQQQIDALETCMNTNTLQEFTTHDDTYWVVPVSIQAIEQTGNQESAAFQVQVTEAY